MHRYGLRDDQWDRIKDALPGREGHPGDPPEPWQRQRTWRQMVVAWHEPEEGGGVTITA